MLTLTDANYFNTDKTHLAICFHRPGCVPCRQFEHIWEAWERSYWRFNFARCNSQDNPNISANFNISAVPTIVIIKQGQVTATWTGAPTEASFRTAVQ